MDGGQDWKVNEVSLCSCATKKRWDVEHLQEVRYEFHKTRLSTNTWNSRIEQILVRVSRMVQISISTAPGGY